MERFLNLLTNPHPAHQIIGLISEKVVIFNEFKHWNPTTALPIYSYPPDFKLANAKDLQTFSKMQNISKSQVLIHSLAHIEYNAMKAYLDTLFRFFQSVEAKFKSEFLDDFLGIAAQEASHFLALQELLISQKNDYGFMPGLDTIRVEIDKTKQSLIERVAVLALIQEGRGLDASPHLLNRLQKNTAEYTVMQKIVEEEVGHVKNGVKWFKRLAGEGNEIQKFKEIWAKFGVVGNGKKVQNMNWKSRGIAGMDKTWFDE